MTIITKEASINNCYIAIKQNSWENGYTVTAEEKHFGFWCPVLSNYYGDEKKAKRRFRDLCRKAEKGNL